MSHDNINNNNLNLALPTSSSNGNRYKGVVLQPNGHWGAQIYANHQRVWLGTFKTERDAAMAYDSAAIKLRSSESYRNLPISPDHLALEMDFQSHFSDEAVLIMIKDGSYPSKLGDFSRSWRYQSDQAALLNHHYPGGVMRIGGGEEILYKDCFEKELTPSDVGKLNRLVIPKKYAIKFFPQVSHVEPDDFVNGGETADAYLNFFDRTMKRWTFRYCYWKSSQSFVFTKGWNKFVKEKGIKTKDVVVFYSCEMKPKPGILDEVTTFTMIDFRQCGPEVDGVEERADGAGPSGTGTVDEAGKEDADEVEQGGEMNQGQEENVIVEGEGERRVLRLFGVDIM